jgi:tetratricopeptide (TPR) repeat protein
MAYEGDSKEVA